MMPRAVVATIAATFALTTATVMPADAETVVLHDRVGDVRSDVDVKRVRVTNGNRLLLTSQHVDLTRKAVQGVGYFIDVNGRRRGPEFLVSGGFPDSDFNIFRTRGWRIVGEPLSCPVTLDIDFEGNWARYSLARDCLDGHRGGVRVSMSAGRSRADGTNAVDYLPARKRFTRWIPFR